MRRLYNKPYRGRFAPTPSGSLHLGSLYTALASYLDAHHHGGRWLLRIDDLDTPRVIAGADSAILRQLEAHGLVWDETPRYQSRHLDDYAAVLRQMQHQLYPCDCTRAELAVGEDAVYAGTCRIGPRGRSRHALRVRVDEQTLCFDDVSLGRQCASLATQVGDFVLRRADGQIAYQLACAVDEAAQAITEVVRGRDLLSSTFKQLWLQQLAGLPQARYRHLPLLTDARGAKLSKQNHAAAIAETSASENLRQCFSWLGQPLPIALQAAPPAEILVWAVKVWNPAQLPDQANISVE